MKSNFHTAFVAKSALSFLFIISIFGFPLLAQTYKLVGTGRYEEGSVYGMDADGSNPEMWVDFTHPRGPKYGSLIEANGKLWGMTIGGGTHNMGTIYSLNNDGTDFTKIHDFNGVNGRAPYNGLTLAQGKLWGMTFNGGINDNGVIYYLETDGNGYTKVHDFKYSDLTNGYDAAGKLIVSNGKLWGMAQGGGVNSLGIIFTIELDGSGFSIVHSFDNTNGRSPYGNSLTEINGTLFGMTTSGGTNDKGTIFKINNDGTGFSKVHDFDGNYGAEPYGSLIVSNGKLWGLTYYGGSSNWGVIFNMDTDGTNFNVVKEITGSSEGRFPLGDLYEYGNKLYGTSKEGGTHGRGSIYSINNDGTNYTIISSFSGYGGSAYPESSLVFSNGKLWGFATNIFNLNADGSDFEIVHDFQPTKGYNPSGRMAESNEKIWGTTRELGSLPARIFTTNIDGAGFEIVHSFAGGYGGDGGEPSPLVAIGDKLWGMCKTQGNSYGTIFYINNDGTGFTKVHDFDSDNGRTPYGTLMESSGKLWGMTFQGGANGEGVIFTINHDGTGYTIVHSFDDTNGANPYGELFESGGKLWGLTHNGGPLDRGVIFSIETDGSGFTKHHDINSLTNAQGPNGSFIEANGKLWATIENGGIISMNTDGTGLTLEHSITNGELLYGNLLHFNNKLWGVTYASQAGTIFTLDDDGTNFTEVLDMDPSFGAQLYYSYGAALIVVNQNHRPTYSDIPTQQYKEDDIGKQIKLTDYFDDVEDGPSGLAYTVENISEPSLFSSTPISSGTMSLNLAANKFGSAEITIRATDTGNKYIEGTFIINISPVADTPSITSASTSYGVKTVNGLVAARNAVDGNEVNYIRVTDITNGTLYLSNGSTVVNNNSFVSFSNASNGFKFIPNEVGTASFNIQASIGNTVGGLGGSKVQATISAGKKMLTASANNKTRKYGAANPVLTITYAGFVFGENAAVINTPPVLSTAAAPTSNVGTYDINISGASDNHYDFTFTKGTLTVTKADLTATAEDKSKNYGTDNPTLTISYSGFLNGDTKAEIDTPPTVSTTASKSSSAGDYPITLTGGMDNNYTIVKQNGTLTIKKLVLTATADDKSKVYGEANPTLTITYTGFLLGEGPSAIDDPPIPNTGAVINSPVGTYDINLSAGSDINYQINNVSGTLIITKATIIATTDDKVRSYGEDNPTLTVSYSGIIPGDDASMVDNPPVPSTTATAFSDPGNYTITLTTGSDNNYYISTINGTLTITKAALLAIAENKSKIYGEPNPVLTIRYEGFSGGEDASVLDVAPTVSTSVVENTLAGEYPISISTGSDKNYDIEVESGTFYVEKALLKVSIDNESKIYGEANPSFVIQYSGFLFDDGELSLDNFLTPTTTADESSEVGMYPIWIENTEDSNYEIEVTEGILTIEKAALVATAANKTRFYNEENPELTINYVGFVVGDNENDLDEIPSLTTDADVNSDAGVYTISITSGSDNNYNIELEDGQFIIEKANQVITFEELMDVSLNTGSITLEASASSGLPVSFSSGDNAIASISDNIVSLLTLGEVTITAMQEGNSNYSPAAPVSRILTISEITGIEDDEILSLNIFPNPASNYFTLQIDNPPTGKIKLATQEGKIVKKFDFNENAEYDVRSLNNGLYFILFETEKNNLVTRKLLINKR